MKRNIYICNGNAVIDDVLFSSRHFYEDGGDLYHNGEIDNYAMPGDIIYLDDDINIEVDGKAAYFSGRAVVDHDKVWAMEFVFKTFPFDTVFVTHISDYKEV